MPIHLTILLVLGGILYGDTIPPAALVWSGTATSTYFEGISFQPVIELTDAGANTRGGGMGTGRFGGLTGYTVDTGFMVTGAGAFVLSSSGTYSDLGSTCWPTGCALPNPVFPALDGSFSASVGISDSNGNPIFGESLGASGTSPYSTDCSDCFATLSLSGASSGTVDLAVGTYMLAFSYYGTNNSMGDNMQGGGLNATLIADPPPDPGPEPGQLGFLLAAMAILFLISRALLGRFRVFTEPRA